jgi:hypothetical protein
MSYGNRQATFFTVRPSAEPDLNNPQGHREGVSRFEADDPVLRDVGLCKDLRRCLLWMLPFVDM